MSSAKTYQLRDIVMLMNESMDSFKKSGEAMTKAFESYSSMQSLVDGLKDAHTHYERGMFRLGVAYEKLAKGAQLEEEKEQSKEKSETKRRSEVDIQAEMKKLLESPGR